MASGRKNRSSRHRSHKHKQQKADDSGDSDTEKNLRHGPMPETNPNPNPNPSSPWTMEPLPPNVEGPSVLKQPDMENVDRKSQFEAQKGSQTLAVKRRKETLTVVGDAAPAIDRWDGGAADETQTLALLDIAKSNLITLEDVLDRKDAKGEGDGKNSKGKGRATLAAGNSKGMERADASPLENNIQITSKVVIRRESETDRFNDGNPSEFAKIQIMGSNASETKARVSKSSLKEKEFELDDPSSQMNTIAMEPERKRARKSNLLQKPKKSEDVPKSAIFESQEEHHSALEKGTHWVIQDHFRNIEFEQELESRIRRREGSRDRERWRDDGKEREIKGSRFQNEEHYQNEDRSKDQKERQEKPKDDGGVRNEGASSSSKHRDESWKAGRHLEDHDKEDSLKVDDSREGWCKDDKDREQKRKYDRIREDRSFEGRLKDDRQKEVMSSKDELKDDRHKEDLYKDVKERDRRVSEGRRKENRSRDSRYKDEKDKEVRVKNQGDIAEEERFTSESIKKEEYCSRNTEEKLTGESHQDDELKRGREHIKEDRPKLKDTGGKLEEESVKDEKEKIDKHREEGAAHVKSKHDKKKGETEQDNGGKHKEDSGMDFVADAKGKHEKKRSEREQDYGARLIKPQSEKRRIEKQQDGKNMDERERHDRQRGSGQDNGKHTETVVKDEKVRNINDTDGKYRDDRVMGERDRREKGKDDGNRHSKRKDESYERRWGGSLKDEREKDSKESFDVQKHTKEMDDRQRYELLTSAKQRGERWKDDRKHSDMEEEPEEMFVPGVVDRLGVTREASRQIGGDKDGRYINVDRDRDNQLMKQSKALDGQPEPKGTHESVEARESKSRAANKGDRTGSKASRATSQDQERVLSIAGAKDASTSENQPKSIHDSGTVDIAIADRDHARPLGRPAEEVSNLLYEVKALHDKSGRRSKFETSVSVSSSSGTRRPREQNWHITDHTDQAKQCLGFDEEVRSWEPRTSNQESDDERRRPFSHERTWDSRPSLSPRGPHAHGPHAHGQEEFVRGPESTISKDATVLKRKHHNFSQGAGLTKARRVDEASVERLERSHQGTLTNRVPTDGPMVRPLPHNRLLGPSALLPPPPPYRPGVDNPTVMGVAGNFVEGSNPRENGRYDRNTGGGNLRGPDMVGPGDTWGGFGMGNWNAHNQGPAPGPGNMFPSFPQMGTGGFLGMGQQFHVPQMFGPSGARPSTDMGFGGARFHMGDGGAGFPGHGPNHGPVMGWHRFPDASERRRPLSGFTDTWEGPGRYPDERQRFGHPDWDQFSQGMSGGGWEGVPEPWQGQAGDVNFDLNPSHSHRQALYQATIGEETSRPDLHMDKVQIVEDRVLETPEISPVCSMDCTAKTNLKASKQTKERMQMLLLHADVSAKLADIDLYKEYLSLLPLSETKKREASAQDHMDVSIVFIDEDLEFEVDSEAQDLLLNLVPSATILPSLSDSAYKDALKIYQRQVQQNHVQKSEVGSFLLPESKSIRMPRLDESVKGDDTENFGEQASIPIGPAARTKAAYFEIAEAKETVEVQHSEEAYVVNAIRSVNRHVEGNNLVGEREQGRAEDSVLGGENSRRPTWQACVSHIQSVKNLDDDRTGPVNEIGSDHSADRLETSQVVHDDQTRCANDSDPVDHLESSQVIEREDSGGQPVEDEAVNSEVLASSGRRMEEWGRSFEGAEAIEIVDVKGTSRHQESPETAHENTH